MSVDRFLRAMPVLAAALVVAISATPGFAQRESILMESAFPTGNRATSVVLLQRAGPVEIRAGEPFSYHVKLVNLTDGAIEDIQLTEQMPPGMRIGGITPQPDSQGGGQVSWVIARLGPREQREFSIDGSAERVADLTGCANVTFSMGACSTTRVVQPQLVLEKTAPAEVVQCDPIPLRLVVTNTGSGVASNVVVADPLPDGWTTEDGRRELMFTAGNLAAGQSRQFNATVRASRTGQFTNRATAQEDGGLTAQASTTTVVRKPQLTLTKTAPGYRFVGRPATFQLTVTNQGDAVARDTVLVDDVPAGVTFVRASDNGQHSGGRVTWRIGDLAPGESRTVDVEVKMTQIGVIRNTAQARAYCADARAEVTLESRGIPAILLEVVDIQDPIEVGSNETYEISVVNQGSAQDTNIVVSCTLPPEQDFVNAEGPTRAQTQGKTVTFAPLPALGPKQKATYRVIVRGNAIGDVRFRVAMTSDQTAGAPVEETESTHIY